MKRVSGFGSKFVCSLVLVAIGSTSGACSQVVSDDASEEATATTSEAVTSESKDVPSLFCADCFDETNGGGPGTPSGIGSNGFVGGVAGYASGAGPVHVRPAGDKTPCDPGVDCVNVLGEPRPLKDSDIRIAIVGREKGDRVVVDLPGKRGIPTRVDPQTSSEKLPDFRGCMIACEQGGEPMNDFCRSIPSPPLRAGCWAVALAGIAMCTTWCYANF